MSLLCQIKAVKIALEHLVRLKPLVADLLQFNQSFYSIAHKLVCNSKKKLIMGFTISK